MRQASWNGTIIAASDRTREVEGNVYFPIDSVDANCLEQSSTTTECGWKGTANYFHVTVEGERNEDAAWIYRDPKPEAAHIKDHVAFWKGIQVT